MEITILEKNIMDKIAILIPCYNEEKTIEKVVKDWKKGTARCSCLCI